MEGRGGEGRGGQGRVPDCLGGLSRVGISSRSTRPWNGQPPSYDTIRVDVGRASYRVEARKRSPETIDNLTRVRYTHGQQDEEATSYRYPRAASKATAARIRCRISMGMCNTT